MSLETTYNRNDRSPKKLLAKLFRNRGRNVLIVFVIAVIAISVGLLAKTMTTKSPTTANASVQVPHAKTNINKELTFPVKNDKGEKVSELKINILDAELTNEIIVKGQKATAVNGRQFLIINLKITNDSKQKIQIDTRDYIRLSVNGNEQELLAPDIHNDPVEVQAISTKYTRLGFPINTTDSKLKLKAGEINGEKTNIDLNF